MRLFEWFKRQRQLASAGPPAWPDNVPIPPTPRRPLPDDNPEVLKVRSYEATNRGDEGGVE